MKTMVKLTVLLATLVLLTGVASASCPDLHCYKITLRNLDTGEVTTSQTNICFNDASPTATTYTDICGTGGNLVLFPNDKVLAHGTGGSSIGYLTFHGDGVDFAGIFYCNVGAIEYRIKGTEIECL